MTQTTSAPRVPAELTDVVVDFLHDEEESLANCSLVCKDWLPAARYHLFRQLLLHPWNVESFVNLITHPSATITPYIRHLVIDQVKIRHFDLFEEMFLRLPRFDFLRRLELRDLRWCNYEARTVDTLISAFNSATDLRLYDLVFGSPTELWSMVTRFPSLDRLSVADPTFFNRIPHSVDVTEVLPHLIPPNIRYLELSESLAQLTHILSWFSSRSTLVNSLSVSLRSLNYSSLNQYLQVLGPSLLFLQVDVLSSPAVYLSRLDLSFSTHLRKLRLCNFCLESSRSLSSKIPAMLATATSSFIHEIEFVYGEPEEHSVLLELEIDEMTTTPGSSVWSPLDAVLSKFRSLRTVRFRLNTDQPYSISFVRYVKRGLSSCSARGILSFEHVNDAGDISSPYLRPDSWNGMVSGPLCIVQMQQLTT